VLGSEPGGLIRPAVFGSFDGLITVLGVLFALAAHPHTLVVSGVGLAAAGAVSMGGGQWLSDSEHGLGASAVIGLTTGAGTLVPVAPYIMWHGATAAVVSAAACLAVSGLIAWLKTTDGHRMSARRAAAQTYGLLFTAGLVTWVCAGLTGAVG
jgi:VIT1/CCC1 family predicted Fe2+/Mn2+ transporter